MPTLILHGGYSESSRYEVVQHYYMGGDDEGTHGYIEVLEIKDPPPDKHPIVAVFWGTGRGYHIWEFPSVETALKAVETTWGQPRRMDKEPQVQRKITQEALPWFYES